MKPGKGTVESLVTHVLAFESSPRADRMRHELGRLHASLRGCVNSSGLRSKIVADTLVVLEEMNLA